MMILFQQELPDVDKDSCTCSMARKRIMDLTKNWNDKTIENYAVCFHFNIRYLPELIRQSRGMFTMKRFFFKARGTLICMASTIEKDDLHNYFIAHLSNEKYFDVFQFAEKILIYDNSPDLGKWFL
jgi:hypothetical protein